VRRFVSFVIFVSKFYYT